MATYPYFVLKRTQGGVPTPYPKTEKVNVVAYLIITWCGNPEGITMWFINQKTTT